VLCRAPGHAHRTDVAAPARRRDGATNRHEGVGWSGAPGLRGITGRLTTQWGFEMEHAILGRIGVLRPWLAVCLLAAVLSAGCNEPPPPQAQAPEPAGGAANQITLAWSGDQPPHLGFGSLDAVKLRVDLSEGAGHITIKGSGQQSLTAPAGVAEEQGQQTVTINGFIDAQDNITGEIRVKYHANHVKDGSVTSTIDREWTAPLTGKSRGGKVTMNASGAGSSLQTYAPVDGTKIKSDAYSWAFSWKASGTMR
jgi:hypothetical protein